ncbi:MAG: hypothetical protein M9961_12910 [Ilumatobacteraceae bacterium]|nr:hypothetical protein [Ilumatobacteraceae bacterium]
MTPALTTLLLCDFAQVRDRLLFVSSGGISRVVQPTFPGHLRIHLALVVHVPAGLFGPQHEVLIRLKYPDDVAVIGSISVKVTVPSPPTGAQPGEGVNVPQVIDLSPVVFPHPGQVDLQVSIDGEPAGDLTFWLLQTPAQR